MKYLTLQFLFLSACITNFFAVAFSLVKPLSNYFTALKREPTKALFHEGSVTSDADRGHSSAFSFLNIFDISSFFKNKANVEGQDIQLQRYVTYTPSMRELVSALEEKERQVEVQIIANANANKGKETISNNHSNNVAGFMDFDPMAAAVLSQRRSKRRAVNGKNKWFKM